MTSVIDRLPRGGRVLIVRLRSLGDCVLTTPAIALLHDYRPDLTIAVMAEPAFRPVFEHNPAVRLLPEPSIPAALVFRAHLALNLHGLRRSMQLTAASLARWRAGSARHHSSWVYNVKIPRPQEILGEERRVHTAEHVASAMFHLGVPRSEIPRAQLFAPPPRAADNGGGALRAAAPLCPNSPHDVARGAVWTFRRRRGCGGRGARRTSG
jgi:ADP-heptose:LPS heptosyltransferase